MYSGRHYGGDMSEVRGTLAAPSAMSLRVPPHNVEAEQALLGSMFLSSEAVEVGVAAVDREDFYRPSHQRIFEAIQHLSNRAVPIDQVSVADRLDSVGQLEQVGGKAYLLDITGVVPTAANAARYAEIVQRTSMLRELIGAASHIASLGYEAPDDMQEVVEEAERTLFQVTNKRVSSNFQGMEELLKDSFKQDDFFKNGLIYLNKRVVNKYQHIMSFSDMGISRRSHTHIIASGRGTAGAILADGNGVPVVAEPGKRDIKVKDISRHIIQNAISKQSFFSFQNIKKYFPKVECVQDFIESDNHLGGQEIVFHGEEYEMRSLSNRDLLDGMVGLLHQIETDLRKNITEYIGLDEFTPNDVSEIFCNKTLKLIENTERANGDEQFLDDKDWYVFNANYGTSEEKAFVRMLESQISELQKKYDGLYLIRNERHFKIYSFSDGKSFEPDFVLFLRQTNGDILTYQIFIEPKGKHLKEYDKWKQEFLQEISHMFGQKTLDIKTKQRTLKFRLIGVPFYNNEDENKFKQSLYEALGSS